jgi:hypothetical protein
MFQMREYSDFAICRPVRAAPFGLSRRLLMQAAPGLALTGSLRPVPADARWTSAINAINATVGVVTNIDALADRIWPKVQRFFHGSQVSAQTVSRVAQAAGEELSKGRVHAVSITENRTPQVQSGVIRHSYDQNFSQAYVDWCLCNAQVNQEQAQYWARLAALAQQTGRYDVAQIASARARKAQSDANVWRRKLQSAVYDAPVQATLPPSKPMLTAVSAPAAVTDVLDQGDFFVAHATAQQRRDAGLASA